MRGRYEIECGACDALSVFDVHSDEDGDLEVVLAVFGCKCRDRPGPDEAVLMARKDFTHRLETGRWTALYQKYERV